MNDKANTNSNSANRQSRKAPSIWILAVAGLILFVTIGWFSPNFTREAGVRSDPLGSDFLQEYAGGVVYKTDSGRLYDLKHVRKVQHDVELLGFQWEESRFFPMVYPPFYYASVSPLAKLPYLTAARVWMAVMIFFLLVSIWLIGRTLNIHRIWILLPCLATPVLLSLSTGQKGTALLLILTCTWCLSRSKQPLAAGVIFGLIAFKPHLGIPIGLFMMARRQWSFAIGCWFTVLALVVCSLLTGFETCLGYFDVTLGFSDYIQNSGYRLEQAFSLWGSIQLAIDDSMMAKVATITMTAIVLLGTCWFLRRKDDSDHDWSLSFSAMVLATVLVAPHLYTYDLTMLVLPAVLLGHRVFTGQRDWQSVTALCAIVAILFGASVFSQVASLTRIQIAVPLLLLAWALMLFARKNSVAGETTTSPLTQPAT